MIETSVPHGKADVKCARSLGWFATPTDRRDGASRLGLRRQWEAKRSFVVVAFWDRREEEKKCRDGVQFVIRIPHGRGTDPGIRPRQQAEKRGKRSMLQIIIALRYYKGFRRSWHKIGRPSYYERSILKCKGNLFNNFTSLSLGRVLAPHPPGQDSLSFLVSAHLINHTCRHRFLEIFGGRLGRRAGRRRGGGHRSDARIIENTPSPPGKVRHCSMALEKEGILNSDS